MAKDKNENKAKILFLDIEASNLSASMGYILCIGYKWAHEKKAKMIDITKTKEFKKMHTDDTGVLREFEKVWAEADIVVHHFGDYYDIPFIQTRRLIKGLKPLPQVATVDTWRIARKKLKFHNNRLDAILEALGCPIKKTRVVGAIWIDAMSGVKKAMRYIINHCDKDVLILEWVYNKIKGAWPSHPTVGYNNKADEARLYTCDTCGVFPMQDWGRRPTKSYSYKRLYCASCGATKKGKKV